jgi:hypothetical protein
LSALVIACAAQLYPRGSTFPTSIFDLVTYDIPTRKYIDHGAISYENGDRPTLVNSIAVGKDGTVYALERITERGQTRTDPISIHGAFRRSKRRLLPRNAQLTLPASVG